MNNIKTILKTVFYDYIKEIDVIVINDSLLDYKNGDDLIINDIKYTIIEKLIDEIKFFPKVSTLGIDKNITLRKYLIMRKIEK